MASGSDNPFLPFDIIIDILKRLYVKFIIRFGCVCKDWKNLFETQYFITEQLRHSAQENPLLLIHAYDYNYKHPSLRLLNPKMGTIEVLSIPSIDSFSGGWTIIGSCNGLLCVELDDDYRHLLLWNPAIKEVREVPQTMNDNRHLCRVGFGFSSIVNDYKIVRFYHQELREMRNDLFYICTKHDRAEVFSLSTGSWKELEFEGLDHTDNLYNGFNADGTIFWWGSQHGSPIVISFDIATEVFKLTSLPTDGISRSRSLCGLGVYENKLESHYVIVVGPESFAVCVWVLDEVASESGNSLSCTQKYRIGPMSDVLTPACFWRNEVVFCDIETGQEEDDPKCIYHMFNINTNERREFNCSIDFHCDNCDTFNYEESLVSVWNTQVE